MNKEEYMQQLRQKLKRLPQEDFERAVEYYEEYFAEAGAENEAKAIEDLGTPQEAADLIIRDMALDYSSEPVRDVKEGFHGLWVAFLALCAAPFALPLLLTGIAVLLIMVVVVFLLLLALLLTAVCCVISGPFAIISGFTVLTKSIPVCLTCVGLGLMAVGLGAAAAYGLYMLCRMFLGWTIRVIGNMIRRGGNNNA